MQIGAPSGQFAGWIHLHTVTIRQAHKADQRALGEHRPAAHACALGDVLEGFHRFTGHLLQSKNRGGSSILVPVGGLFLFPTLIAALVFFLGYGLVKVLVIHYFNDLLFLLLFLFLIRIVFLFFRRGSDRVQHIRL